MICLKISTFVVSTTTGRPKASSHAPLWFAWKYLPLWYQQQHLAKDDDKARGCDLLENIYLCGINNNGMHYETVAHPVVICLKISTFVVSTTTLPCCLHAYSELWFAWKYLPLWYQQQLCFLKQVVAERCDLLENIYLCGINNNSFFVICCLSKWYKVVEENKKWCHKTKSHFIEVGFLFSIKVTSYDAFSKFFLVVG